jgi:hypothetical protein
VSVANPVPEIDVLLPLEPLVPELEDVPVAPEPTTIEYEFPGVTLSDVE